MALSGSGLAGDDHILLAADEFEAGQVHDEGLVEVWLKGPVESLQRLALGQAAVVDAALDPALELEGGLGAEDPFEQGGSSRLLPQRPGHVLVEACQGVFQSEELEVSSEPLDDLIGSWRLPASRHGGSLALPPTGRRSYSSRSRRKVSGP